MKSKKIHKVILKNPHLRQIRNNLRTVLKLAINEELDRLGKFKRLYILKKKLTPSQKKRWQCLSEKWNSLYHRYRQSTLQCACGAACSAFQEAKKHGFNPQDRPIDLDLVWIPWLEEWICIDDFEKGRYGEMTHEDFDDPVYREWVKKEFEI